jgi:NAD(P)-dependent dehydrogenase (short-subunit alcohol dehydrogenase family)
MSNPLPLEGKVAIVTGSGRGIGRSIALAYADSGADVALFARTAAQVEEAASEVRARGRRALAITGDVTDERRVGELVRATLSELGRLDILVNNVGVAIVKPFMDSTPADWQAQINWNIIGTLLCTHAVGGHFKAQRGGKVINISSVAGIRGKTGMTIYGATKAAVIQFTKILAVEWAPLNVNVNCIVPGAFYTQPMKRVLDDPTLGPIRVKKIPMQRYGDPDEIGPLAVYLASDASRFMTGSVLTIDGGEMAKM